MTYEIRTQMIPRVDVPTEPSVQSMANLISTFLHTINHELRTPLTAILGFSELMLHTEIGTIDPRYRDYAHNINASGERLLNLLTDILDLAQIETGLLVLTVEQVIAADMIDQCRHLMLDQATAGDIEIIMEVPAHLPPVQGRSNTLSTDPAESAEQCSQVQPERRESDRPGAVRPNGDIELSVTDTGVGMTHNEILIALNAVPASRRLLVPALPGPRDRFCLWQSACLLFTAANCRSRASQAREQP
ncbi:MAG: HAMP domain-containing sensor histidine kinase [Aliidongia sp.]